jgi:hypothetical protein
MACSLVRHLPRRHCNDTRTRDDQLMTMLVHQPTKSLLLRHPDPLSIRDVLPNSKLLDHPDYNLAVHHTLEAAKVLRNMGCDAPAPIRFEYRWPGKFKPFQHQIVMSEFLTLHRRAFNLSEMGTMKTNAALWAPTGSWTPAASTRP